MTDHEATLVARILNQLFSASIKFGVFGSCRPYPLLIGFSAAASFGTECAIRVETRPLPYSTPGCRMGTRQPPSSTALGVVLSCRAPRAARMPSAYLVRRVDVNRHG